MQSNFPFSPIAHCDNDQKLNYELSISNPKEVIGFVVALQKGMFWCDVSTSSVEFRQNEMIQFGSFHCFQSQFNWISTSKNGTLELTN